MESSDANNRTQKYEMNTNPEPVLASTKIFIFLVEKSQNFSKKSTQRLEVGESGFLE